MLTAARFLRASLALTSLLGALAACSQPAGPVEAAPVTPAARGVVIAQLVTHDSKVAILGGGGELRVVIRKMDGAMVADGITLTDLRTRDPDVYDLVTSSYVDATLDLAHLN